eukprot:353380-Chlamydomonas_euryale.AAC.2
MRTRSPRNTTARGETCACAARRAMNASWIGVGAGGGEAAAGGSCGEGLGAMAALPECRVVAEKADRCGFCGSGHRYICVAGLFITCNGGEG